MPERCILCRQTGHTKEACTASPCKWCGSRTHQPANCRIKQKHEMLVAGATAEEAGLVVLEEPELLYLLKAKADYLEGKR